MPTSLRKALIDSHVAAATIAILLFLSLGGFYVVVDQLLSWAMVLTRSEHPNPALSLQVIAGNVFSGLSGALGVLACAWLLSYWVFGAGPPRSLASYRDRISRRLHA